MSLNRREMLRWSAAGLGGMMLSSAATPVALPSVVYAPRSPLPQPNPSVAPGGINPALFDRAKAALDSHRIAARDTIGVVDFSIASRDPRFHLVDLASGQVKSFRVAHGSGSDPAHSGYLDHFSNQHGSEATSNGAYTTGDYYHGKYGLSMKVRGHDWTNNNAENRAIVIHSAWYAEADMVDIHGKLGRSQGCFAFSSADQREVMTRLAGGRMIYADKLA